MLNREIILDFLRNQSQYLRNNYHILKIGLIGSFARDEQSETNDIDLLVEFEPGTEDLFDLKIKLKDYLKSNFKRDIDICRVKYLKPYAKEYLMKEVIYV